MSTASSPFQITHTITLPTQPTEPVTVVAAFGVSDADFRLVLLLLITSLLMSHPAFNYLS
ncbi:hypothetical protein Hanom_Chr07g00631421 [Helianthus anomalus]